MERGMDAGGKDLEVEGWRMGTGEYREEGEEEWRGKSKERSGKKGTDVEGGRCVLGQEASLRAVDSGTWAWSGCSLRCRR